MAKTPDLPFYEQLLDTIVSSDSLRQELRLKLQRAFEEPESFYDDSQDVDLSERGLTYPEDASLTPKFVLIDTLLEHEQLAEVDWKEEEEEIRFALNTILQAKGYPAALAEESCYGDEPTADLLALLGQELAPLDLALVTLNTDADSYAFTVVPLQQKPAVEMLFGALS